MSLWIAGAAVVGAGMNMYSASQMEGPESGYDVVESPTYDWAEGSQKDANTYMRDQLNQMQRGEEPQWMQNTLGPMQQQMQQSNRDRFYGSAGRPGVLRDVQGMGAVTGIGPKATMAKSMQAEYDFMTEGNKIDQYINSLKFGHMSQASQTVPQQLAGMPRGPESQVVSYGGGAGQTMNQPMSMDFSGFGGDNSSSGQLWNTPQSNPPGSTYGWQTQSVPASGGLGGAGTIGGWSNNYSSYPKAVPAQTTTPTSRGVTGQW